MPLPFDMGIAFLIGLSGSIHCVGMCGGIVTALSMGQKGAWPPGLFLYHAGRITTYCILGLLLGIAGDMLMERVTLVDMQRGLSILAGIIMILFALQTGGWMPEWIKTGALLPASLLRRTVQEGSPALWGLVGLLNGLLPCGMVYAALPLALKTANTAGGVMIMAAFGAGTVPAMTALALTIRKMTPELKGRFLKGAAILLILFGLLTIYRGILPMHEHSRSGAEHSEMDHSHHEMSHDH